MDPILRLLLTIALIALVVWVLLAVLPITGVSRAILIAAAAIACVVMAFRALGSPPP